MHQTRFQTKTDPWVSQETRKLSSQLKHTSTTGEEWPCKVFTTQLSPLCITSKNVMLLSSPPLTTHAPLRKDMIGQKILFIKVFECLTSKLLRNFNIPLLSITLNNCNLLLDVLMSSDGSLASLLTHERDFILEIIFNLDIHISYCLLIRPVKKSKVNEIAYPLSVPAHNILPDESKDIERTAPETRALPPFTSFPVEILATVICPQLLPHNAMLLFNG